MADVQPKKKTTPRERIAQLVRLLGTPERGERVTAWNMLKSAMADERYSWNDIGNDVEHSGANGEGKYSEEEMLEFAQAARAEAIEEGIRIGMVRGNGHGNGHLHLPEPAEMAEFCNDRQSQLNDWERKFIADMVVSTRGSGRFSPLLTRWNRGLRPRQLGTLAKIFIQLGGKV